MIKKPGTPDWAYGLDATASGFRRSIIWRAFWVAFIAFIIHWPVLRVLDSYSVLPPALSQYLNEYDPADNSSAAK